MTEEKIEKMLVDMSLDFEEMSIEEKLDYLFQNISNACRSAWKLNDMILAQSKKIDELEEDYITQIDSLVERIEKLEKCLDSKK